MAGAGEIRAGKAFVEASLKDNITKGLEKLEARLKNTADRVGDIGKKLATIGIAGLGGAVLLTKQYASMGDALAKASTRTGVAVEQLSLLKYAADQSGSDLAGLELGIKKLANTITDAGKGTQAAVDALALLGLSFSQLTGKSPDEQFKLVADRLSKIEDPTLKVAVAMDVFGKSAAELIPLIEGGRAGIEALEAQGDSLAQKMSTTDAKAAEAFGDALDDLTKVGQKVIFQLGAALAPAIKSVSATVTEAVAAFAVWLDQNREQVSAWAKSGLEILAWVAAAGATIIVISKVIAVGGALIGLIKGVSTAMLFLAANPIGAVLIGIGALIVAFGVYDAIMHKVADTTTAVGDKAAKQAADFKAGSGARKQLLDQLDELAQKTSLNSEEQDTALGIIQKLNVAYDSLGLSIDAVTGKIVGNTRAQQEARKQEAEKQLALAKNAAFAAAADRDSFQAKLDAEKAAAQKRSKGVTYRDVFGNAFDEGTLIPTPDLETLIHGGSDPTGKIKEDLDKKARDTKAQQEAAEKVVAGIGSPFADATGKSASISFSQLIAQRKAAASKLAALQGAQEGEGRDDQEKGYQEASDRLREQLALSDEIIRKAQILKGAGGFGKALGVWGAGQEGAKLEQDANLALREALVQRGEIYSAYYRQIEQVHQESNEKNNAELKKAADEEARIEDERLNRVKDFIDKTEAQHQKELDKRQYFLEQLKTLAEKSGDTGLAKAADNLLQRDELEARLKDLGLDEAMKEKARALFAQIQAKSDVIQKTFSGQGLFNAAGIQSLQGNQLQMQDRATKAAEETARNTKKIEEKIKDVGLTFGG